MIVEMNEDKQNTIVFQEIYGSTPLKKDYFRKSDGQLSVVDRSPKYTSVSQFFRSVFLPQGYPESVSEDYVTYQIWDTVQAFASSITGTMAAQAMLKGVGVGDQTATVLAATMTWLLKDGTGMLGRIVFAWIQGTNLDCDAKRWRLFADILNDFAIFLEILAPNFPRQYFTPIVCVAGVCKSVVGVAGGATRAALTQHQARRNNMADVSAKDGSQETLVNLAALICNLVLVPMVTGHQFVIWMLYLVFTAVHLYANYSAVTSVVMETLNQARLHILLQSYFKSAEIPSIRRVNKQEPVIFAIKRKIAIRLGSSLSDVCKKMHDLDVLESIYRHGRYMLALNTYKNCVYIVLHDDSTVTDQIQSLVQAEVLEYVANNLHDRQNLSIEMQEIAAGMMEDNIHKILQVSYKLAAMAPALLHQVELQGWDTQRALLGADEWRAHWDFTHGLGGKKDF
ncbi:RUS family member 1-like [Haliotis cracherodii]|uniref:RUS family member 1-like n=1 Tax=Haliotis cracherodii TaxID=6455 RepID=UPI0039ED3759